MTLERVPVTAGGERQAPAVPQAWFLVARADELPPGGVLARDLPGLPLALFRTASGTPHALAAHCWHMGTHLAHGRVVGDCLRCPLHHWEFDGAGTCRRVPGASKPPAAAQTASFPIVEQYGALFVFNGPEATLPPPTFQGDPAMPRRFGFGPAISLRVPWYALVANAFDRQHLEVVHGRVLREPARVERLGEYGLRVRYRSRVVGRALADRTMQWLASDDIRASITCWGGPVTLVESDLGRVQSTLLIGMVPTAEGTAITPLFAVPRTANEAADRLRLRGARWLFGRFLGADLAILEGMRFAPRLPMPPDDPLAAFLDLLNRLPAATAWGSNPALKAKVG